MVHFPGEYPVPPHTSPLVKRSSHKEDDSLPETPSLSRKVRFAASPAVHSVVYNYTAQEKQVYWYSHDEYDAIKLDAVACLRKRSPGGLSAEILGLESRTLRGQHIRQERQYDTKIALMFAKTPKDKRQAYLDAGAARAAKEAAVRGQLLAIELKVKDSVSSLQEQRMRNSSKAAPSLNKSAGNVKTIRSRSRRSNRTAPMICI